MNRIERHRAERARLRERAAAWRRSLLPPSSEASREKIPVAVLPANQTSTSKLPARRRARFAEHLRELIQEIEQSPARRRAIQGIRADTPEPLEAQPTLEHACAVCRGHCCLTGGEHAYLGSLDLMRFRSTQPGATNADIVQTYLDALPERSYTGACVFQGTAGCVLPREMRADICNAFLCDGARELSKQLTAQRTRRAFLVAAADGELLRATEVDEEGRSRKIRKR